MEHHEATIQGVVSVVTVWLINNLKGDNPVGQWVDRNSRFISMLVAFFTGVGITGAVDGDVWTGHWVIEGPGLLSIITHFSGGSALQHFLYTVGKQEKQNRIIIQQNEDLLKAATAPPPPPPPATDGVSFKNRLV
jgi:hypothetical protein